MVRRVAPYQELCERGELRNMAKDKAAKDKSKKAHKDKHHKEDKKDKKDKLKKGDKKDHKGKGHKRDHAGKGEKKDHSTEKQKKHASLATPTSVDSKKSGTKGGKKGGQPKTPNSCAEHGVWTDVTQVKHPPADQKLLYLSAVDPEENEKILSSGKMSFAMVGCSGDPKNGTNTKAVGAAVANATDLSFFYHLGDMIYTLSGSDTEGEGPEKAYTQSLWDNQLFGPYAKFPKKIFAIAGNHDGKYKEKIQALHDFFGFFCADTVQPPTGPKFRRQTIQPYIYWSLDTPYAYIIGLYSNIANGGILDKPTQYTSKNFTKGPQYQWLVKELKNAQAMNKKAGYRRKAVLLTVHYPPYSGKSNFNVRGDQSQGGPAAKGKRPAAPNNYDVPYLAQALQQAFKDSGQRPHAIFSAHAHLFERLTYTFADGTKMPCVIAGCGGHSPLEQLFEACDGTKQAPKNTPFPAVTPGSYAFPKGDSAQVDYYDDLNSGSSFGYLKVTIDGKKHELICEFMGIQNGKTQSISPVTISY